MAEQTPIQGSKLLITVAAMLGALMSVIDISIVNVALSDIRASFGTPLDRIAWVSTGYAMANVTVIPLSGWLQRRFGFRNYFAGSLLMFTAASALCAFAWNLPSLVVFRILQGIGGGAIIPTSQNILFGRYPHKEHGMAGALFALGAITGPLLGPTMGGKLIDVASWHWIFLINVPVGLLAAWVAFTSIKEPGFKPAREPIDGRGIGLLAVGMVSLQYVLEEGNRDGWFEDTRIVVLACAAAICLVTFVVHELEIEHPVVDFRVFKNVSYTAATALNFLLGTALFAGSFLYSLFCGTDSPLRGDGHRDAVPARKLDPAPDHAAGGPAHRQGGQPRAHRLRGAGLRGLALDQRAPHPARRHPRPHDAHLRALAGARASASFRSRWSRSRA